LPLFSKIRSPSGAGDAKPARKYKVKYFPVEEDKKRHCAKVPRVVFFSSHVDEVGIGELTPSV
jgi:hypothetical protein